MKALFGVVSLLVALAIVGLLAVRQLKAVGQIGTPPPAAAATTPPELASLPALAGSGTVREQSVQLQKRVGDDVAKALSQGAAARQQESEK